MRWGRWIATAALGASLVLPGSASAVIHSGHIRFEEPTNPPSIGPTPPPADQTAEYQREVLVRYDASAGTVVIEDEVWDAAYWGENLQLDNLGNDEAVHFALGATCDSTALEGLIEALPATEQPLDPHGVFGQAVLRGYTGTVYATGSFTGQRFVSSISDPAFRQRNWRCVTLAENTFPLGEWPPPRRRNRAAECKTAYNRWRREEAHGRHAHRPPAYCQA